MKDENHWAEFVRIPCKSGYIDIWIGDCANNPNNPTKSGVNLNAFRTFYRFDHKQGWFVEYDFKYDTREVIRTGYTDFTSVEIWDMQYIASELHHNIV